MSGHRQYLHLRFGEKLFVGLDTACLRCCCSLLPGSLSSLSADPQHPRFCLVQGPARPSPGRQSHSHGSTISLAPFHTHVILPATISHHSQSSSRSHFYVHTDTTPTSPLGFTPVAATVFVCCVVSLSRFHTSPAPVAFFPFPLRACPNCQILPHTVWSRSNSFVLYPSCPLIRDLPAIWVSSSFVLK